MMNKSGSIECGQTGRLEKLLDDPESAARSSAVRAILEIEDKKSPRLMAVLLEMIADKSLTQEWRMDILGRIKETAPTLSREGRGSPKFLRPRVLLRIQRYWG